MTNKELKTPSLLDALLPILALIVMMGSAVYLFADNSSYGPNQIALLLAMGLAAIIGMKNGYSWKTIEKRRKRPRAAKQHQTYMSPNIQKKRIKHLCPHKH